MTEGVAAADARIRRVRKWLRVALYAETAFTYAAFLLVLAAQRPPDSPAVATARWLAAGLVIFAPHALGPLRQLFERRPLLPYVLVGLVVAAQFHPMGFLVIGAGGPVLLALLAGAHGLLVASASTDRWAAAAVALGPIAVVAGFAVAPGSIWLFLFPLVIAAAVAALLLLQARRAREAVLARTPAALISPAAILGAEEEQRRVLRRLAFYTLPLTLVLLLAIPAIYIAVLVLPEPILHDGEVARNPNVVAEEAGPESQEDADARETFEQIFPSAVSFSGGVSQLQHETVMHVRPDPTADLGPLYMRGIVLDTLTATGARPGGGNSVEHDAPGADGWVELDERRGSAAVHEVAIRQQRLVLRDGDLGILFPPARLLAVDVAPVRHDPGGIVVAPGIGGDWFEYRARFQERRGTALDVGATRARHRDRLYRRLPRGGERELLEIRALARSVTADARTDRERVHAIVHYFQSEFEYSLTATEFPGLSGVVDFLRRRNGPCTYYSSASALMLRSLDIPARIATGFLAKEFDDEKSAYVVTTREGHAWIEVHFEGVGWVTYDPTPGDQRAAALAAAQRPPADSGLGAWMGELAYELRRWATSGGDSEHMRDFARALADGPKAAWASLKRAPYVFALLAGAVVAVLGWRWLRRGRPPAVVARRVLRQRAADSLYRSLLLALARRGFEKRQAETLREFCAGVLASGGELYRPLSGIGELFYRARFGGEPLTQTEVGTIRAFVETVTKKEEP